MIRRITTMKVMMNQMGVGDLITHRALKPDLTLQGADRLAIKGCG